jgi:hypothetical protein
MYAAAYRTQHQVTHHTRLRPLGGHHPTHGLSVKVVTRFTAISGSNVYYVPCPYVPELPSVNRGHYVHHLPTVQ